MEIRYYHLEYDDIEQISELERKFFSTPWSPASIGHYADAGNTIFIVARCEEPYVKDRDEFMRSGKDGSDLPRRVVGYAALLCAADEGNLVSIGVDEDFREMGIASTLLDILYEQAQGRGVASINLEVRKSNEAAIGLYEGEGFEAVGKRPGFYSNPKEDAVLYIKKL